MSNSTDEMVRLLPYQFNKSPTGNIYKVLDLFGMQIDKIANSSNLISLFKDIGQASGKVLDMIGAQYGVARPTNDDTLYRLLLKMHLYMSTHVGTLNEIIQVLAFTSGLPITVFQVHNGDEPLAIRVDNLPTAITIDANQKNLIVQWISAILPAGIRLEGISFTESQSQSNLAIGGVIEQSLWFKSPVSTMNVPGA